MAQPISPTPELTGRDATRFLNRIYNPNKKPVGVIPTPKLAEAEKIIKQLSVNGKNNIH